MAPLTLTAVPTSAAALHAAYEQRAASAAPGSHDDWRRNHLGASVIGHDCDRFLWLLFRWAANPMFKGKLLRLFERGNREETWIIEDLRAAGFEVADRDPLTGEQFVVSWGHFGGHLDGVVLGLLEAPKTPHVLEVKTHNRKQFEKLLADGVKRSKPQHYAQMQVYMRGRKLDRAYYVAVCKDDDRIHTERVYLDREFADSLLARADAIIAAPTPPARQANPDYPPCVYTTAEGERFPCQFLDLCFGVGVRAEKNCRTCVSSTPVTGGGWHCAHHDSALSSLAQRTGCAAHLTVPEIINAQVVAVDEAARRITYQAADGQTMTDGGSQ